MYLPQNLAALVQNVSTNSFILVWVLDAKWHETEWSLGEM